MPTIIIIILLIVGSAVFHNSGKEEVKTNYNSYKTEYKQEPPTRYSKERSINYDDALDEHWDEIKEYINGTESVEVYSHKSNGYYTLDADISNGEVESIHFPNGGYIYVNAELNSDGTGDGYGSDGYWDVEIDSSLIEDAVEEWASDNGYSVNH